MHNTAAGLLWYWWFFFGFLFFVMGNIGRAIDNRECAKHNLIRGTRNLRFWNLYAIAFASAGVGLAVFGGMVAAR